MYKLSTIFVLALSLALTSCYDSNSEDPAPAPLVPVQQPPTIVGLTSNGSIYYQSNCAVCHKAGQDDPTSAFGASDLAQRHDMITTDMSSFDATSTFDLMGAFGSVPAQRTADLKAYLQSVPAI